MDELGCYDIALYEVESPVITRGFWNWDRVCSTWEAYLRWKTRGFPERHERGLLVVSVSVVHERNKAALLSISKQATHVSTNEYRLNRQACSGIQSVPLPMILTSGVFGLGCFAHGGIRRIMSSFSFFFINNALHIVGRLKNYLFFNGGWMNTASCCSCNA